MKKVALFRIKDIIKDKREELDELLSNDHVDKEKALELSVELDKLISKYYCIVNE
ncbi:Spo0E family sporulation regulatory protein-aspartic acid phosphatase [Brassicibacter mesophilus]|uniref:Spo0E family sporulation regulatory protein-aspartic acid phosphatase n=1 Tax=Brassicibacter mesophilus TaxID=745119 RepID=UPI003D1C415B